MVVDVGWDDHTPHHTDQGQTEVGGRRGGQRPAGAGGGPGAPASTVAGATVAVGPSTTGRLRRPQAPVLPAPGCHVATACRPTAAAVGPVVQRAKAGSDTGTGAGAVATEPHTHAEYS